MDFHIVIPARYESSRLHGKVLADIAGKSMLQHVYERAKDSGAASVVIATDHNEVAKVAESFGATVCMTSSTHASGTERIAEAVEALELDDDDIVICLQADEPLITPKIIKGIAEDLEAMNNIKVASCCEPIKEIADLYDRSVVKVILNKRHHAMYFSRATVPWDREQFGHDGNAQKVSNVHYRHVGLYGYRVGFLKTYVDWAPCALEKIEMLEQLRILFHGVRIHMRVLEKSVPRGVDTEDDLKRVRSLIK
jgi:3-deoxy-manno-octulosonate cytidylyltransferase (CMP-KDO synthetase)